MNITSRPLRNAHETFFAPTGDRIYTSGDYLCGYAIPSLERLFRIRGRIASRCISIRPHDDQLICAYADGLVDIRDGITGKTRETFHLNTASELPDPELYDEQHIVGWTRKTDLPHGGELKTMGVTLSDEQHDMQIDNSFNFPIEGDKLLGWPAWQQNVESHECPVCHEAMKPIFQIDACHGVPALFADGGRGWIVQCPKHRDTVAMHWTY